MATNARTCALGSADGLAAVELGRTLIIFAWGQTPTPCTGAEIPPTRRTGVYDLMFCADPARICAEVLQPYLVHGTFSSPSMRSITVRTRDGDKQVQVRSITLFHEVADGTVPIPFRLASPQRGASATLASTTAHGQGSSSTYDLVEGMNRAIADAMSKISSPGADALLDVTVTRIGALIGGFAGFNEMVVEVDVRLT